MWEEYRAAHPLPGQPCPIVYAIGRRKEEGFYAGPFADVNIALAQAGVDGDVIMELPRKQMLYKWKNGEWFNKQPS